MDECKVEYRDKPFLIARYQILELSENIKYSATRKLEEFLNNFHPQNTLPVETLMEQIQPKNKEKNGFVRLVLNAKKQFPPICNHKESNWRKRVKSFFNCPPKLKSCWLIPSGWKWSQYNLRNLNLISIDVNTNSSFWQFHTVELPIKGIRTNVCNWRTPQDNIFFPIETLVIMNLTVAKSPCFPHFLAFLGLTGFPCNEPLCSIFNRIVLIKLTAIDQELHQRIEPCSFGELWFNRKKIRPLAFSGTSSTWG